MEKWNFHRPIVLLSRCLIVGTRDSKRQPDATHMKMTAAHLSSCRMPVTSSDSQQWKNVHTDVQMLATKRMPSEPSRAFRIRNMKSKRQLFKPGLKQAAQQH